MFPRDLRSSAVTSRDDLPRVTARGRPRILALPGRGSTTRAPMGSWRGRVTSPVRRAGRRRVAVVGLPALARGASPEGGRARPGDRFRGAGQHRGDHAVRAKLRVVFQTDDLFRIWMTPDGVFTDPANTPPERGGGTGRQHRRQAGLPGRDPAGDRCRHLPAPRDTVAGLAGLQGQPALRPLPARRPDADLGGARRPDVGRATDHPGAVPRPDRAVLRWRHAERPVLPPGPDHQGRRELRLGRRRPPQLGAVLRQHRRLRRPAQHAGRRARTPSPLRS